MLDRLPRSQAILQVYAVIAVLFAGWTITAFLWKLSAWLLLLNLGEIFTIFSYAMFANLVESLIVVSLLLLTCVLLPPRLLRDDFAVRGTILAVGLIGSLMAFVGLQMQLGIENKGLLFIGPGAFLLLMALLLALSSNSRFGESIRSAVLWVSDRLMVFLYILVPLFVILSAYVIFRNMG